MVKKMFVTLSLACALSTSVFGNLIGNPGFESNSLAPWTTSTNKNTIQSKNMHSGLHSANLVANSKIQQTVTGLNPNTSYTLTAWVRASIGSNVIMMVQGRTVDSVISNNVASYQQLSLAFITDSSTSPVQIVFAHSSNDYSWLYIDDVELNGGSSNCTITITKSPAEFIAAGGTSELAFTSNTIWEVIKSDSWISLSKSSDTGNAVINVTASANSGAARQGTITIRGIASNCQMSEQVLTITQQAASSQAAARGDMEYFDGSTWVRLPVGKPGEILSISKEKIPQWTQTPETVTDIDGNVYKTIIIGDQEWTVENLRTTHYRNGDSIPHVADDFAWEALSSGAYCYINNAINKADQKTFGALYNWYAVNDARGLAPEGWRVPTNEDWNALANYMIANAYNYDESTAGNKLAKSLAAQSNWSTSSNPGAIGNELSTNNRSGFSAQPGGFRHGLAFTERYAEGYWWSSTGFISNGSQYAIVRNLSHESNALKSLSAIDISGLSVRLVRDVH